MRFSIQLLLMCVTLSCGYAKADTTGWDVTVKGKVKISQKGVIKYQLLDSVVGVPPQLIELQKDSTFSKTFHLTEPTVFVFNFYGKQMHVMLDHSNMEINVVGKRRRVAEITGSPDHDLYDKAHLMRDEVYKSREYILLMSAVENMDEAKDRKKSDELSDRMDKLRKGGIAKSIEFISQQPPSLGLYLLLREGWVCTSENLPLLTSALAKFQQSWPTYSYTKELAVRVGILKALEVGQVAPDIAMPNAEGEIVKLSSLRGKYVLIDFWSAWCCGCRAEHPNFIKAYNRFHSKGFDAYSVSLDIKKEDWIRAFKKDGMPWTQVCDLKGWKSQTAKEYNISSIPVTLLLDKNGVILAKDFRGTMLEEKLEELLGKEERAK